MGRDFTYIVLGASGVAGQYVVEKLAKCLKEDETIWSSAKWAVAGRDEAKIAKCLKGSSEVIGIDLSEVPVLHADVNDEHSINALAENCDVLLNCVGPYRLYGDTVVSCCVQNGTNYVDISGEPDFLEQCQLKYNELAEKNGCYIVGACGWDSVPCDLGVEYVRRHFAGELNGVETFAEMKPGPNGYVINSGTYKTLLLGFSSKSDLGKIRRQIMPEKPVKSEPVLPAKPPLFYYEPLKSWAVIFPGSDRSVCNRSIYHNYHGTEQPAYTVHTYLKCPGLLAALMIAFWAAFTMLMSKFDATRKFCEQNVKLCTFGMFADGGPTRLQASTSSFTYWFFARGKQSTLKLDADSTNPADKCTAKMAVRCDGPDVGYNATAVCLVAAAMCVANERKSMPNGGGVFTPAVAFAKTDIYKRLEDGGITFKVGFEYA